MHSFAINEYTDHNLTSNLKYLNLAITVGTQNLQAAVAKYLSHIDATTGIYNGTIQGRLINDTDALNPMDLIQNEEGCFQGSQYWIKEYETCSDCPSLGNMLLDKEKMNFDGVSKAPVVDTAEISIENGNDSPVNLYLKSIPPFISYSEAIDGSVGQQFVAIEGGSSLGLEFRSSSETLSAGSAVGEVVLGLSDAGTYPGCVGNDIRVAVEVHVSPGDELNQLGGISAVGFTLSGIVILLTFLIAAWSFKHRKHPAVKKMQPPFLLAILVGVFVLGEILMYNIVQCDTCSTNASPDSNT